MHSESTLETLYHSRLPIGRAGGIRTHDLLNPIQAFYQAELRPDFSRGVNVMIENAVCKRVFMLGLRKDFPSSKKSPLLPPGLLQRRQQTHVHYIRRKKRRFYQRHSRMLESRELLRITLACDHFEQRRFPRTIHDASDDSPGWYIVPTQLAGDLAPLRESVCRDIHELGSLFLPPTQRFPPGEARPH